MKVLVRLSLSALCVLMMSVVCVRPALAGADWQINCLAAGKCETNKLTDPLFAVTNAVPGQIARREIIVRNKAPDTCLLVLGVTPKPETDLFFATRLLASFYDLNHHGIKYPDGQFEQALNYFFTEQTMYLGAIAGKTTTAYTWQIQFDPASGNQYQGRELSFDAELIFECDPSFERYLPDAGHSEAILLLTEPTPTPTCAVSALSERPKLTLTKEDRDQGSVDLAWSPVSNSQYYLRFGPPRDPDRFIHTAINNNQYHVAHLSIQNDYVFQVGGQADCALGPLSNRVTSFSPLKPEAKPAQALTAFTQSEKNLQPITKPTHSIYPTPPLNEKINKNESLAWQFCWQQPALGVAKIWLWLTCWFGALFA